MKVKIIDYSGYEIYYNTDYDRFYSELDRYDEDKKQSFATAKAHINDHLKENQNFQEFEYRIKRDGIVKGKIVGLKKNGNFIAIEYGSKEQKRAIISSYQEEQFIKYAPEDDAIYKQIETLYKQIEEVHHEISELLATIRTPSLKDIKKTYIKN